MKSKHLLRSISLSLFLSLVSAAMVFSAQLPQVEDEYNGLFFRNSEVILDHDQNGEVSVGDVFWGVLSSNGIVAPTTKFGQSGPGIWPPGPPAEITGYFATEVVDILEAPPEAPAGTVIIVLAPTVAPDPNGILDAGEVLRIFESDVANYNDSTQGLALATATDGDLVWSFGMQPTNDGFSLGGYWYSVAVLSIPGAGPVGNSYAGLNVVIAPPDSIFGAVNDPSEFFSDLDVQFWFNSEIFRLSENADLVVGDNEPMHFGSNDPAVYLPQSVPPPGKCRMTGGSVTANEFIDENGDVRVTYTNGYVEGTYADAVTGNLKSKKSAPSASWVTTGGQIGAPSVLPATGHWSHTQHAGAEGIFTFLAGTASAPTGTEISDINCADPGWCVQARCAPYKQIFWDGVGYFPNKHGGDDFNASFPDTTCTVTPGGPNRGEGGTLHYFHAMVGDFGDNNKKNRQPNNGKCDWPAPSSYDVDLYTPLDAELDDQFGDKGGQVCDECADYYQIQIFCGATEATKGEVIYTFEDFIDGGNFQIHPETSTQCTVDLF